MKDKLKEKLLERLSFVERKGEEAKNGADIDDFGPILNSGGQFHGFRSAALSFIESALGKNSSYYSDFSKITNVAKYGKLIEGIEIIKSIREEIENDWVQDLKDIVSGEIFSDFLEMAEYFLENEYRIPAAVILGSVLEEHLRQLATKNGIDTTYEKNGDIISKNASRLNDELAKEEVYGKLDQKNITSWLELRNNAAHGYHDKYNLEQVRTMFTGVSEFISRKSI